MTQISHFFNCIETPRKNGKEGMLEFFRIRVLFFVFPGGDRSKKKQGHWWCCKKAI